MSLQNLQAEFADILLSDDERTELVQPAANMFIYKNNITRTLVSVLRDIYPLITKLVGIDFFNATAKEYINRYPSRSSNLHDYGEYFSDFLKEYPTVENLIYLPEVALFEWTCHTLQFAPDHPPLDIKLLEDLTPEKYDRLQFNLHPASQLIAFHYPILRIIDLCKKTIDETIDIEEGGVNLLIIRRHLEIILKPLTNDEFIFLQHLQDGHPLTEALNAALDNNPQFSLEEKLPAWVQDKTIVEVILS